jgi:hypothetical protein
MEFDPEQIRQLAYQIWEAGGRRPDSQQEDWLCAEQQLRDLYQGKNAARPAAVDESVKESFPASDAPATHAPDIRPVNADAKWAAAKKAKGRRH